MSQKCHLNTQYVNIPITFSLIQKKILYKCEEQKLGTLGTSDGLEH